MPRTLPAAQASQMKYCDTMTASQKITYWIACCVVLLIATLQAPAVAQVPSASVQKVTELTTGEGLIQVLMKAHLIKFEHFYVLNGKGESESGALAERKDMKLFAVLLKKCNAKFVGRYAASGSEAVLHASKLEVECDDDGGRFTVTIYNSSAMYVSDGKMTTFWHLSGGGVSLPFELVKTLK
ncbi:MAG: hypothetical protein V4662_21115 [Verrucomicrobiota bacterium]